MALLSIVLLLALSLSAVCAARFPRAALKRPYEALHADQHSKVQSVLGTNRQTGLLPDTAPSENNYPLNCFQVYQPVEIPPTASNITTQILLNHSFGNSYNHPYIGTYTPPPKTSFTNIHLNLTVTSQGRQFDRLALLFLNDIEILRTSTAEPTPSGIIWTYTKDVTPYLSLWRLPRQTVIFDLGNLINEIYTASFDTIITLTFFTNPGSPATAFLILSISAQRSSTNQSSAFSLPADNATSSHVIPLNTTRALVSLAATGQSQEEFWYTNVPNSYTSTFNDTVGELYGASPHREVHLYIDGHLAGLLLPFPVIFTGGFVPGLWRPMVGIDASDLREPELDITPWLPYLSDGKPHAFTIGVYGINGISHPTLPRPTLTPKIGNYWVVTGKLFLFFSFPSSSDTTNPPAAVPLPYLSTSEPSISISAHYTPSLDLDYNKSLHYIVSVSHELKACSISGCFHQFAVSDLQSQISERGLTQDVYMSSAAFSRTDSPGIGTGLRGKEEVVTGRYEYHSAVMMNYTPLEEGFVIEADVRRLVKISSSGREDLSLFTLAAGPSELDLFQGGQARLEVRGGTGVSFGNSSERFREVSGGGKEYKRDVGVVNGSVVRDKDEWDDDDALVDWVRDCGGFLDGNVSELFLGSHLSTVVAPEDVRSFIGRGSGCSSGMT